METPFLARTGFKLDELPTFFRSTGWRKGYGGEKWALIAQHTLSLRQAIAEGNPQIESLAIKTFDLWHNSSKLLGDGKGQRRSPKCWETEASTRHA